MSPVYPAGDHEQGKTTDGTVTFKGRIAMLVADELVAW
jgi:hypothetical protein